MKHTAHKALAAILVTGLMSTAAFAQPGNGKNDNHQDMKRHDNYQQPAHNHKKDHKNMKHHDDHYRLSHIKDCPPGLRDKGCMPPGQAKKYQIGQPLPWEYNRLTDYRRYDLPNPRDGYYYSKVGQDILLVSEATRNVAELVTIVDMLAD